MTTIETWRIQQFRQMIQHNLQEQGGKLRPFVTVGSGYTGKQVSPIDHLGVATATKVVDRLGDNPMNSLPHSRRWVVPVSYEWGIAVDNLDKLTTGISPEGEYSKAGTAAIRRGEDAEILSAFFASAKVGETGGDSEAWADSGYVVDENTGGSNSGLNHQKLKALRKIFTKKHVDLDAESPVIAITEEEELSLFGENATTSIDYVDGRPVSTGKLPPLYGFRFVTFSSDTLDAIAGFKSGNVRTLPVWVPSGMHLGIWKDAESDIWNLSGKKNVPYVYACQTLGATRTEKGRVLKCKVYNA